MKKIVSLLLAAFMVVSICGCKSTGDDTSDIVSYITTEEEVVIGGNTSGTASGGSTSSGTTSGNKNPGSTSGNGQGSSGGNTSGLTNSNAASVENLDFGGQTFTKTIIGSIPKVTIRRKEAFEKKYNCKIKLVSLKWETYNSQVATAMASGSPYDICGLAAYFWPEAGVQNLYEPLNDYLSDSDLYDSKTGVGIDLNNSKEFELNGKLYGVSTHSDVYVPMLQVLYYNKLMFKDAGLEDPLKLWEKGQWTWDKLFEYGKAVTNASKGKYLMGQEFSMTTWVLSNGFKYTKTSNGKITQNLSDKLYLDSLKKGYEFYSKYVGPKGYSDDPTEFYNGNYYMFCQVSSYGTYYMYDSIVKSSAFGKSFDNLGVVPFPYGQNNTGKTNPAHGGQAKSAGKGSKDPRVVIAWTKFASEFEDPMQDEDPSLYSSEIYSAFNKCFDNINNMIDNYKTSSDSALNYIGKIEETAKKNGDITKAINDYSGTIQSIINSSLGQK